MRYFASLTSSGPEVEVIFQPIPGIGAVLTAGFNYYYVQDVGRTAIQIYQERFLLDKKGRKRVVTINVE